MKKYITITSLLVAGTAFANAEPVITLTDLNKDITGDVSYSTSTSCLSGETLFSITSNGATRYTASTTINIDLTALGISSSTPTYSGSSIELLAYRSDPTVKSGAIGIAAVSSGLQFTWEGNAYQSGHSIRWSSLLSDSYNINDRTYVTLTLEGPTALDAANGGTFVYNRNGDPFKSNGGTANYGFSSLASSTAYDTIYLNKSYVTGASVFSGIATKDQMIEARSLVAVPEPSAFGLLAGIGALALVASRRRRK